MKAQCMLAVRNCRCVRGLRRFRRPGHAACALLLCGLAFVLSACSDSQAQGGTEQLQATTPTPAQIVSPTDTPRPPTITLHVVGCPSTLTLDWDRLVGTHDKVNKVESVTCASLEGQGTLQALINVRYYSSDGRLDFYVYDNLAGIPLRRFGMQDLLYGDVRISSANTITTAEVGPKDSLVGDRDLFKEYAWNGTAFVQTSFPALYPDVTRYQADQAEASVTAEVDATGKGPDTWRLSARGVTGHLAQYIFHWSNYSLQAVANSRKSNLSIISVANLGPGGGGFIATLHRFNGMSNNIFEITQISPIEGNITLSSPAANAQLASPVQISGSTPASGGVLGRVVIYDDTYTIIGDSGAIPSTVSSGYVQFSRSIGYALNDRGTQEGIVAFYQSSQGSADYSNQVVLIKVLLTD